MQGRHDVYYMANLKEKNLNSFYVTSQYQLTFSLLQEILKQQLNLNLPKFASTVNLFIFFLIRLFGTSINDWEEIEENGEYFCAFSLVTILIGSISAALSSPLLSQTAAANRAYHGYFDRKTLPVWTPVQMGKPSPFSISIS